MGIKMVPWCPGNDIDISLYSDYLDLENPEMTVNCSNRESHRGDSDLHQPMKVGEVSEFVALVDLTLRKKPHFAQALVACPATTVCEGTPVHGEVVKGRDGGAHLKIVVLTPPEEGSRQVFCFLPLHAYGKPRKRFLQPTRNDER